MKITREAQAALAEGFAAITEQYRLNSSFPEDVIAETSAVISASSWSGNGCWRAGRRDATEIPFVTLDPASSTDLDQAFYIERDRDNLILHYALADVGAFVSLDGAIEGEAMERGVTIYGLSEKVSLYPKKISQAAASLLPDGPRPAVLVSVSLAPNGRVELKNIERVVCASREKLAYDTVNLNSIAYLEEFAERMWADEITRGAIRVEFPQQEVVADSSAPGGVRLILKARVLSESINSTLSLAVNMAIGNLMYRAGVGLFRVMDDPEPRAIASLRRTAEAIGIRWLPTESLRDLQRRTDTENQSHQRFLLEARRAGGRASYAVYSEGKPPWHAAIGAVYAHATAPMRRLADRYVLDLANHLFKSETVPAILTARIAMLPDIMQRCESRSSAVERAVIDLLEAVSLQDRIGEILEAEVVDAAAGIVQTTDWAIRAKATALKNAADGDRVRVRIDAADPKTRTVKLAAV